MLGTSGELRVLRPRERYSTGNAIALNFSLEDDYQETVNGVTTRYGSVPYANFEVKKGRSKMLGVEQFKDLSPVTNVGIVLSENKNAELGTESASEAKEKEKVKKESLKKAFRVWIE